MTKIKGYEDYHMVNIPYDDGSPSREWIAVKSASIYTPRFTNGGDEPSGEATPIGVHSREDDRQKTCPSPTYTREELVEVIAKAWTSDIDMSFSQCVDATLDALIALGVVRVK